MTYGVDWPPLRGDYTVGDPRCRVAVVTLSSSMRFSDAAISGPCVTENLGVEKVVANVISNINIRYLIICGVESKGHLPGDAIIALHRNGVDLSKRIMEASGAIPFVENLSEDAVKRFRVQVEVIDQRGLEDRQKIEALIKEYSCRGEPYPEAPIQVLHRRPRPRMPRAEGADTLLGSGTALDAGAWIVTEV